MKFKNILKDIKTYEAGKPIELVVKEFGIEPQEIVKLASNENPNGCSNKVKESVSAIVANMSRYPDDSMMKLYDRLSKRFAIAKENLIIGSGSDQIIEFLIHAKAGEGSKILMNSVTFAMYEIYAKYVGAEVLRTSSREHNLEEFYALYKREKPSIIFLCTPNNPTGDAIDRGDLFAFIEKIDDETLVVIDGAYMEYAQFKCADKKVEPKQLMEKFSNVIYLGTFSKAYGLGGMRVGYGISSEKIIKELSKLRPPFNITTLSLEAASVALEDEEFVQNSLSLNFKEMLHYEEFARENALEIIESYTNFVTLIFPQNKNASDVSNALLRKGMIVRDLNSYGLNALRITVGTPEQNKKFFALISKEL